MTPACSAAAVARSSIATLLFSDRSTLLSIVPTQRIMTASEVLTWIAFREPEKFSRADTKMKLFVDAWNVRHPGEGLPAWLKSEQLGSLVWLQLGQLLAEADAELLCAISENREPVYGSAELQTAAEANQLDRDRQSKLDDAAEQLRQACAAKDVTPTGRLPSKWNVPPSSQHHLIPPEDFGGAGRAIKADGRLLDTQGGMARALWISLEFRTEQILAVWLTDEEDTQITQESRVISGNPSRITRTKDVEEWFKDYKDRFLSDPYHPPLSKDLNAARTELSDEAITRFEIESLREQFVPSVRRPRGRRPNSPR